MEHHLQEWQGGEGFTQLVAFQAESAQEIERLRTHVELPDGDVKLHAFQCRNRY